MARACPWCHKEIPESAHKRRIYCSTECRLRIHNRGRADGGGAKWTKEAVIDAIQRFHAEHGRVPKASEFGAGHKDYLHERCDYLPRYQTLIARFGSAKKAIGAAGFEPNKPGIYVSPTPRRLK